MLPCQHGASQTGQGCSKLPCCSGPLGAGTLLTPSALHICSCSWSLTVPSSLPGYLQ